MSKNEACLRREAELKKLSKNGWPVEAVTRWHWCAGGVLHIWPATGRWRNTATGEAGILSGTTMRDLIARHVPEPLLEALRFLNCLPAT